MCIRDSLQDCTRATALHLHLIEVRGVEGLERLFKLLEFALRASDLKVDSVCDLLHPTPAIVQGTLEIAVGDGALGVCCARGSLAWFCVFSSGQLYCPVCPVFLVCAATDSVHCL